MDADSVEHMTDTENPVITPIACALPNRPEGAPKMHGKDAVKVLPGTLLRELVEGYDFEALELVAYEVMPALAA